MSRKVNVLIHPNIQDLYKNLSKESLELLQITIDIANKHNGEILNADSMQVYKEIKILSARPDKSAVSYTHLRAHETDS